MRGESGEARRGSGGAEAAERDDAALVAADAFAGDSSFMHGGRFGCRLRSGEIREGRNEELIGMANAEHALGLQDQVPAAGNTEFREQRGDVELHGAKGNVEATGDFLIQAIAHDFTEDLAFPGAKGYGGREGVAEAEKLTGEFGDASLDAVARGDTDFVIGRMIAAKRAGKREKSGGALERGVLIAVHNDAEARDAGLLL